MTKQKEPVTARVFSKLSDVLENGIDIHRCVAAGAIAEMGYPGAGQVLQNALIDEDEDVRSDAVAGLVKLGDPETAEAVMENFLGDPCPEVKLAAIQLLADVNHRPIVDWLLKLVVSADEEINWDHDGYYSTGWEDWLDIQKAAITGLGKMGVVEAIAPILTALNDEDGQDVTHVALPVLAQLGDDGIQALTKIFENGDTQLRRRICTSLTPGSSEASDDLIGLCLQDNDGDVRYVAVEKIIEADINDPRLVQFYEDADSDVRKLVVESIGARKPEQINKMLSDKSPGVRQAAFRAIANEPERFEKDGFSEVVRIAIAGVPEVAGDAAVAWAALIGAPSANSLGQALQNPAQPLAFRCGLVEALTLLDDDGFPFLAEASGDENRQVRITALTAIAEIARQTAWPNDASETLLAALNGDLVEPLPEKEENNEEAKGDQEAKEAKEADQIVEEPAEEPVEKKAVSTLDQIVSQGLRTEASDDEEAEEPVELTERDEQFLEVSKLRAMRKGKVSLDLKIAPYQDVRQFAARLLGDFNEAGVIAALGDALEQSKDEDLTKSCLESLALIGQQRGKLKKALYDVVIKAVDHNDRETRMFAIRCLGLIDGDEVIENLVALSQNRDVHVRLEAVRALGAKKSAKENQIEHLIKALQDDYSGVRSVAVKILAEKELAMDDLIGLTFRHDGMHRKDITALFKKWNSHEAAAKYLAILGQETRKRDWLVAIQALGELLKSSGYERVQAVA